MSFPCKKHRRTSTQHTKHSTKKYHYSVLKLLCSFPNVFFYSSLSRKQLSGCNRFSPAFLSWPRFPILRTLQPLDYLADFFQHSSVNCQHPNLGNIFKVDCASHGKICELQPEMNSFSRIFRRTQVVLVQQFRSPWFHEFADVRGGMNRHPPKYERTSTNDTNIKNVDHKWTSAKCTWPDSARLRVNTAYART